MTASVTTRWTTAPISASGSPLTGPTGPPRSTSPGHLAQLATNFNAPTSVASAAVLYVFRTLVDDDIPLNDGCLRPLSLVVPSHSMLAPEYPAAVVAGNVETSQAVTGALYAALGDPGRGVGDDEQRDVRQRPASVLRDRGVGIGRGRRLRRHIGRPDPHDQFAPDRSRSARVAVSGTAGGVRDQGGQRRAGPMARRRRCGPAAAVPRADDGEHAVGSSAGAAVWHGRRADREPSEANRVERVDGDVIAMAGCDLVDVEPGDVLVIETPGGGGYGAPTQDRPGG